MLVKNKADVLATVVQRSLAGYNEQAEENSLPCDSFGNYICVAGKPVCVGVVSATWHLTQMRDLVEEFEHTLPDDIMEHALITDSASYNHSYVSREYVIPMRDAFIPYSKEANNNVGTSLSMLIRISTGYDGNTRNKVAFGTYDLICANGMVAANFVDAVSKKHTSAMEHYDFAEVFNNGAKYFEMQVDRMRREAAIPINAEIIENLFTKLNMSKLMRVNMLNRVLHEADTRGMSLFAVESALTYYASHNSTDFPVKGSADNDNEASVLHGRQEQVNTWLNSSAWAELMQEAA